MGKSTQLLFRRSEVQIPATTWWLTTTRNEIWCPLLVRLKTATVYLGIKINRRAVVAHTLIPVLGRQRQVDFWVRGQPGLQSEFQDSQGYTEKPCLKKQKTNKQQKKGIKNLLLEGFRFVCAGRGELYMNQGLLGGKADALLQNLQSASMLVNCFLLCLKFSFYFTCMCFAYMYACTPCGWLVLLKFRRGHLISWI